MDTCFNMETLLNMHKNKDISDTHLQWFIAHFKRSNVQNMISLYKKKVLPMESFQVVIENMMKIYKKESDKKELRKKESDKKELEKKELQKKELEKKELEKKEIQKKELEKKELQKKELEKKELEKKELQKKELEKKELQKKELEEKEHFHNTLSTYAKLTLDKLDYVEKTTINEFLTPKNVHSNSSKKLNVRKRDISYDHEEIPPKRSKMRIDNTSTCASRKYNTIHNLYNTQMCMRGSECNYSNCQYAHCTDELRCSYYLVAKNGCRYGPNCLKIHN